MSETPGLTNGGASPTPDFDPEGGYVPITAWRNLAQTKSGRWVPSIPIEAPIDVRWVCEHEWTPHVYSQGWDAWNYFDCVRCGVNIEAEVQPENGPWTIRRWLGLRFFAYGRAVRRRSPNPPHSEGSA